MREVDDLRLYGSGEGQLSDQSCVASSGSARAACSLGRNGLPVTASSRIWSIWRITERLRAIERHGSPHMHRQRVDGAMRSGGIPRRGSGSGPAVFERGHRHGLSKKSCRGRRGGLQVDHFIGRLAPRLI